MTVAEHNNFNIWKVLGIILVVALWITGLDNLTDYCLNRHSSTILAIVVAIPGGFVVSWLAYRAIRWIIEY